MTFILRFTNPYGERFYFQNLGLQWPHDPRRHLIERTTTDRADARVFDTEEEANETIVKAGDPRGWDAVPNA